jgi:hypothetical protein
MIRSKYLVLYVSGGIIAAASGALFMDGVTNVRLPGVADLASMLSERSPGKRDKGALSNKKRVAAVAPQQQQKPVKKVLPTLAALAPPAAVAAPATVPVATALPVAAAAPLAAAAAPAAGAAFLPAILPIPGGGGGGGITVTQNPPTGNNPPPPPPPPPAVPEPETWLMMITGFGLLGFVLRRRRRQSASDMDGGVAYVHGAARQL